MSGAAVVVNIYAIWLVINNSNICSQGFQNCRHSLIGCTIGAVQHNLHALKAFLSSGENKFNVLLQHIMTIFHSTHLSTRSTIEIIIMLNSPHNVLQLVLYCIWQLVAVATKKFDTVIMEWIVRSRNNNTCLSLMLLGEKSNSRCRNNTCRYSLASSRADTCHQGRFKHLTRNTGIPANQNYRLFITTGLTKIQGCRPAHTISQLRCQLQIGLATNAISSKQS